VDVQYEPAHSAFTEDLSGCVSEDGFKWQQQLTRWEELDQHEQAFQAAANLVHGVYHDHLRNTRRWQDTLPACGFVYEDVLDQSSAASRAAVERFGPDLEHFLQVDAYVKGPLRASFKQTLDNLQKAERRAGLPPQRSIDTFIGLGKPH